MHGDVILFFFHSASLPAVLGNFLIPMMIGAKDLAFPKINLLSWYIYIIGGCFVFYFFGTRGVGTPRQRFNPPQPTFLHFPGVAPGPSPLAYLGFSHFSLVH